MYLVQKENHSLSDSVKSSFHEGVYRIAAHIHQMLEIVYIIDGEMLIKTRGKRIIAKAGDVVLIHPYQAHGFFTEDGKRSKIWMLLFSNTFIVDIIKMETSYKDYQNAVFTPSKELRAFIESKMFDTKEKLIEMPKSDILGLKALLYPIFDEYTKKCPVTVVPNKNFSGLVNATLSYLQNNFFKDITIDDCAAKIGYSKSHISHSLAQSLGTTFIDLRNSFRMDFAKTLLLSNDMSVFRVGLECGFNCERSFERAFKKSLNMTPKEFRNRTLSSKDK